MSFNKVEVDSRLSPSIITSLLPETKSNMRQEMLNYIHEGHQGKEHCLLRAKNTVFWPKITYNIQQLIDKCMICHEYAKSQLIIGATQELPPYPWHTMATDLFYWKRMDFLIVGDVFSKYILRNFQIPHPQPYAENWL